MTTHSGLQKEVLALYRKILRVAAEKDRSTLAAAAAAQSSSSLSNGTMKHVFAMARQNPNSSTSFACHEFRRQANQVKRNDFKRIEYMIRKGEKHIKLLSMPGVNTVGGA